MEVSESLIDCYCLVCGGKIEKKANKNKYRCTSCGEVYELEEFDTFEIELSMFDKLLLHSIKKKKSSTTKTHKTNQKLSLIQMPLSLN
jgi:transcription initiation factor TFIIIB Brf1 subunit/transcription initiation factor TFIIB